MSQDGSQGRGVGSSDNFQEAGRSDLKAVTIKDARADRQQNHGGITIMASAKSTLPCLSHCMSMTTSSSPARTVLCTQNSKPWGEDFGTQILGQTDSHLYPAYHGAGLENESLILGKSVQGFPKTTQNERFPQHEEQNIG